MNRIIIILSLLFTLIGSLYSQQPSVGNFWFVVVGVDVYRDRHIDEVGFAVNGVNKFLTIYRDRQLVNHEPIVLDNKKAEKNTILNTLKNTFINNPLLKEEDVIVFYFIGHGLLIEEGKEAICPYDYELGDPRGGILRDTLVAILQQSRAKHKVCFIEACKSEGTLSISDPAYLNSINQARRSISKGFVYITSTEPRKDSGFNTKLGGYFNHYLLRGLEGEANPDKDGFVTVTELYQFVQDSVLDLTKDYQRIQINDLGDFDPNLPVMVVPENWVKPTESKYNEKHFRDLLNGFVYDGIPTANKTEARALIKAVGGTIISETEDAVRGSLGGEWEITFWAGTYGKGDTYGVRYGKANTDTQSSYFAVEKPVPAEYQYLVDNLQLIRGDRFTMGDVHNENREKENDERPLREVLVSDFYLSKYEVTNAEFAKFLNEKGNQSENGHTWIDLGRKCDEVKGAERCRITQQGRKYIVEQGYDNHPVIYVSWYGASAYVKWLSTKTGKKFRLPTEAEWEYAAGNGIKHEKYSWGNDEPSGKIGGNVADEKFKQVLPRLPIFEGYDDGYSFTAPVGQFAPNEFGLYDMNGNVWEWCQDTWHGNYEFAPWNSEAWINDNGTDKRVLRGGSWWDSSLSCRTTDRWWQSTGNKYYNIGFRLVRSQ